MESNYSSVHYKIDNDHYNHVFNEIWNVISFSVTSKYSLLEDLLQLLLLLFYDDTVHNLKPKSMQGSVDTH